MQSKQAEGHFFLGKKRVTASLLVVTYTYLYSSDFHLGRIIESNNLKMIDMILFSDFEEMANKTLKMNEKHITFFNVQIFNFNHRILLIKCPGHI